MGFLNKNKTVKSLLYYIGEVAVVTIGIFVAIQLNNLNEEYKNEKEGAKSLERIHTDLQSEKMMIESYKKQLSKSVKYLRGALYQENFNHLDSILHHTSHYFTHYKMSAEYTNLKYSGKLHLITNDSLRYALASYYEVYYAYFNEVSERQKAFVDNYLIPYYQNEFLSDTSSLIQPEIVKAKLEETKFRNLVIDQYVNYQTINKQLQTTAIDQISKMIKREIK